MENNVMRQEVQEAISAGQRALSSLRAAKERLGSAKNWGLMDLFGGGFLTDLTKHSRLNDAAASLDAAQNDLRVFQKELRDVQINLDLRRETGGFLMFADFFLDCPLTDFLMQSKIAEAGKQVEESIDQVEYVLASLNEWK